MFKTSFAAIGAALALVCSLPAVAQTQTVQFTYPPVASGSLTTAGDIVQINSPGGMWATVTWSVSGAAGTSRGTAEYSYDGGINFIAAPFSKRTDAVSANPIFTAMNNSLFTSTSTWETPLPANATQFRLRCSNSGTATPVQINGGLPYGPTSPVVAVLYDNAVTAGANNNTGTIDVTGWRQVAVSIVETSAATGAASLNIVDEQAVAIAIGTSASIAIGTFAFGWGDSGTFGTANPFTMVGGVTALPLDRRFNIAVAGATTSATRIRVVARR